MTPPRQFPNGLLNQPPEARLSYFTGYTVAHPILKAADDALTTAINNPCGASLIFVYGPTGVGKTTLKLRVYKRLIETLLPSLMEDHCRIPAVGIEAIAPESGNFNWRYHYKSILESLSEPLIEHKIDTNRNLIPTFDSMGRVLPTRRGGTLADLRTAVECTLKYRKVDVLFIDEAQHLTKMSSGRRLQDQLDCIKSLASTTGTTHVLVGTYELLPFRNLSGQLSRRSTDIHFSRYKAGDSEEEKAFKSTLFTFQRHLPLEEEPDLLSLWDYFYERTLGCVGVLKEWLTKSLATALRDGGFRLTLENLKHHALSVPQCKRMATEIIEGENRVTESDDESIQLRRVLGLDTKTSPPSKQDGASASSQAPAPQKRKSRVGQRKPVRDQIGAERHAG